MKYSIKESTLKDFKEDFRDLEELLTERISDLHKVPGMTQGRHAYIFYRKELQAMYRNLMAQVEEIKPMK